MNVCKKYVSQDGQTEQVWYYCPGCKNHHAFTIKKPGFEGWTFNNDFVHPTFSPSLLCNKDYPDSICHCFVKEGKIEFLMDCHHELKGQTVPMEPYDE